MAISAKMLQYRGAYENFNPSALLPGQFAVVLSGDPNTTTGKAVYMCFETGKATRILADGDVVSGGGDVDLSEYYKKTETYSKEEIDEMFANFSGTSYPDAEGVAF